MKTSKISTTLFLISIVFLSGCVVLDKYELTSTSIDLSKFEKQGVFVTTGDLSQKYKSVSILVAVCYDGIAPKTNHELKKEKMKDKNYDDAYVTSSSISANVKNFDFKPSSYEDLFSGLLSEAISKGANGIIKLEIRNISRLGRSGTLQNGVEMVGLAIKIEE